MYSPLETSTLIRVRDLRHAPGQSDDAIRDTYGIAPEYFTGIFYKVDGRYKLKDQAKNWIDGYNHAMKKETA